VPSTKKEKCHESGFPIWHLLHKFFCNSVKEYREVQRGKFFDYEMSCLSMNSVAHHEPYTWHEPRPVREVIHRLKQGVAAGARRGAGESP